MECIPDSRAVVFPMVKYPFVVGFLVAEFHGVEMPTPGNVQNHGSDYSEKATAFPLDSDIKSWDVWTLEDELWRIYKFTADQRSNAINISQSLAMAYVMDQVRCEHLLLSLSK